MRIFIALVLALFLYSMIDFGWEWILIGLLQLLAGLDLELFKKRIY